MKVFTSQPQPEVRVFKPDPAASHYEVWLLEPVRVGTADRLGHRQIMTDDKQQFVNLGDAADHLLERAGKLDVIRGAAGAIRVRPRSNRPFTGRELADLEVWRRFKELRGMTGASKEVDFSRIYLVTPDECDALGLPAEDNQ